MMTVFVFQMVPTHQKKFVQSEVPALSTHGRKKEQRVEINLEMMALSGLIMTIMIISTGLVGKMALTLE